MVIVSDQTRSQNRYIVGIRDATSDDVTMHWLKALSNASWPSAGMHSIEVANRVTEA